MDGQRAEQQARLLLVEDEAELLTNIAEYLRNHGFEVQGTADREEAITWLSAHTVDVVVSDIHLTDRHRPDGLEIAFAAWKAGIPVLLITGFPTDALSNDSRLRRVAGLIRKPFALSTLHTAVTALLDKKDHFTSNSNEAVVKDLLTQYAPWMVGDRDFEP